MVWGMLLPALASAQATPQLAFAVTDGHEPGLYSPAAVFAAVDRVIVRGYLVMPDSCRELRARLGPANDRTVEVVLERYHNGDGGCMRAVRPRRYEAVVSPVVPGPHRVLVRLRDESEHQVLLADVEAKVPYPKGPYPR
jgi:hypothetical protein